MPPAPRATGHAPPPPGASSGPSASGEGAAISLRADVPCVVVAGGEVTVGGEPAGDGDIVVVAFAVDGTVAGGASKGKGDVGVTREMRLGGTATGTATACT